LWAVVPKANKLISQRTLNIRNKLSIEYMRRNVAFVPVSASSADPMERTQRFVIYPIFSPVAQCLECWASGALEQFFSTAGPRPGTGPWHQLYRAARGSPRICHFSFLSSLHE